MHIFQKYIHYTLVTVTSNIDIILISMLPLLVSHGLAIDRNVNVGGALLGVLLKRMSRSTKNGCFEKWLLKRYAAQTLKYLN